VANNLVTIIKDLREKGIQIQKVVKKSDGCVSQYKSANCFASMAKVGKEMGCTMELLFTVSGHGKSEVDGAAGFLKTAARKAVESNAISGIQTAEELVEYANLNLQIPKKTTEKKRITLT
jgi:hypothetical protein